MSAGVEGAPTPQVGVGSERPQRPEELKLWSPRTFLSLAVTFAVLVGLFLQLDVKEVWRDLRNADPVLAVLGALCHYATYPVRGTRWKKCLARLHPKASSRRFGLIVFFYNAVDNLVPAKLGDLYAAHLIRINLGLRRSAALGSIAFVRIVDLVVVLVLAGLSAWTFVDVLPPTVLWTLGVGVGLFALAILALAATYLLHGRLPALIPEALRGSIGSFFSGMVPRRRELFLIGWLTTLIWGLELAWIWLLAMAFGIELSLVETLFLTMIPLLASTFPLTPSGAGVVELTFFGCLRVLGVASPLAASFTVLNRFFDYWLHIFLGLFTWAIRKKLGLRTWREVPLENTPAIQRPLESTA